MIKFKTLGDALRLAEMAHFSQLDKAGMPYIDHPKRVLATVQAQGVAPYVQIAALFHDITEDTAFTPQMLLDLGFSEAVVKLVKLLDRGESAELFGKQIMDASFKTPAEFKAMRDEFYYGQIKANRDATIIKLADIRDNMSPWRQVYLEPETQARLRAKYAKAVEILNPRPVNHGMITDWVYDPYHLG